MFGYICKSRGDNSPLSVLRQSLFNSYDKAVIPQQVKHRGAICPICP